jgi:DNA-binding transcriptional regulator YdaS (Cro superfamily)
VLPRLFCSKSSVVRSKSASDSDLEVPIHPFYEEGALRILIVNGNFKVTHQSRRLQQQDLEFELLTPELIRTRTSLNVGTQSTIELSLHVLGVLGSLKCERNVSLPFRGRRHCCAEGCHRGRAATRAENRKRELQQECPWEQVMALFSCQRSVFTCGKEVIYPNGKSLSESKKSRNGGFNSTHQHTDTVKVKRN